MGFGVLIVEPNLERYGLSGEVRAGVVRHDFENPAGLHGYRGGETHKNSETVSCDHSTCPYKR